MLSIRVSKSPPGRSVRPIESRKSWSPRKKDSLLLEMETAVARSVPGGVQHGHIQSGQRQDLAVGQRAPTGRGPVFTGQHLPHESDDPDEEGGAIRSRRRDARR